MKECCGNKEVSKGSAELAKNEECCKTGKGECSDNQSCCKKSCSCTPCLLIAVLAVTAIVGSNYLF